MRFKTKLFLIGVAVVLCMTAFSFTASANVSADEYSVNDSVESKIPLKPKGSMTTVDDVHQVNGKDEIEDKQFITVQSKSGNTFYIIIDRSSGSENVYFLNAVDENDLISLLDDGEKSQVQSQIHPECTCTEKCDLGHINSDCDVCSKNIMDCTATATPTPQTKTEEPAKQQNSTTPLIGLVLLALLGGGGAFYWFNLRNKKSSTKGSTDPEDLYEEDDEDYETENEETEIETSSGEETDTDDITEADISDGESEDEDE